MFWLNIFLHNSANGNTPSIEVIGRVYYEYVHILVRDSLRVKSLSDMKDMRIWMSTPESGTRHSAERLFELIGLTPRMYEFGW